MLNWTALIGRQERGLPLIPAPGQQARMNRAARRGPLQAADVAVAGAPDAAAERQPDPAERPLDNGIAYMVVTIRDARIVELKGCADRAAAVIYAQTG